MNYVGNVRLDAGVLTSALHKRCREVLRGVGDDVIRTCAPFVPYDTGRLAGSVKHTEKESPDGGSTVCEIRWETPYAAAVYYGDRRGVRFSKEFHPHATARWFDAAKSIGLDGWLRNAAEKIK